MLNESSGSAPFSSGRLLFFPSASNYLVNQNLITKVSADASRKSQHGNHTEAWEKQREVAVVKVVAINNAANNTPFLIFIKQALDGERKLLRFEGLCPGVRSIRCETAYGICQLPVALISFRANVSAATLFQEARNVWLEIFPSFSP